MGTADDTRLELSKGYTVNLREECEVINFGSTGNDVHKLDVLRSKQINRIMKLYVTVWALCIGYVVISATLACTIFFTWQNFTYSSNGTKIRIRATQFPTWYSWIDLSIPIAMFCINITLAVAFTVRVTRNNHRTITEEQCWVVVLLISSSIVTIPIDGILDIHDRLIYSTGIGGDGGTATTKWSANTWMRQIRGYVFVIQTWSSTISSLFYLFASAHSYGVLNKSSGQRCKKWTTHVPKIVALLFYQLFSLYGAVIWNFYVDKIPLTTLPSFLVISRTIGEYSSEKVLFVVGYTLLETVFLFIIWMKVLKTYSILNEADYLKYRSKQISFRFFVFNNVLYNFTAILSEIFLHLTIPKNKTLSHLQKIPAIINNNNEHCIAGLSIFNTSYLFITSYVHLPPESEGLYGWIFDDSNEHQTAKTHSSSNNAMNPLTLQARETNRNSFAISSFLSVGSQHRDSVVMETHCELFNFAWLAYEYHRMPEVLNGTSYKVKKYINCKEKDVHVLIIDCVDRIVVAFKGTTSLKNVKTDLRIMPVLVHEYLPTIGTDVQPEMSSIINSPEWSSAFTHAGFTEAYTMICGELMDTLGSMMRKERRTIMLTGHSLGKVTQARIVGTHTKLALTHATTGGALATLCALDIRLSLGLEDDEILTVSFGAPRCGNVDFQNVYDKLLPLHWRVCLNRDVITGFPKFGYIHLGRCVLLTTDGKMYVDPSHLDYMLMTAEVQSTYFHKKPAYMIAMKAFCLRHLKSFQPSFWKFPIPNQYLNLLDQIDIPEVSN